MEGDLSILKGDAGMAKKVKGTKEDFPPKDEAKRVFLKGLKEILGTQPGPISNHLFELYEQISRFSLAEDPELRKLGVDCLHEAERDLQSCRILYSKKIYPHATYHFQQAVEKAIKGYVWGFGLLPKDKKSKTHKSIKLFVMTLQNSGLISWAVQFKDTRVIKTISDAERVIGKPEHPDMARMSYEEIELLLSQIDRYRDEIEPRVESMFGQISNIIKSQPPPVLQALSALVVLFILSVITLAHEAYTRYPDRDIIPTDYTANLGVVRAIPKMMKYLQPQIDSLKKAISGQAGLLREKI